MRKVFLGFLVAGAAWAQSLTEFGGAAATGAAGGAAGKPVSDGLTAIFGKVDSTAKAAAKQGPSKEVPAKQPPPDESEATKPATAGAATTAAASSDSGPALKPVPKAAIKPVGGPPAKAAAKSETPPAAPPFAAPPVKAKGTGSRAIPDSVPDPPAPAGQRTAVTKPAPAPPPPPPVEAAVLPPPPPPREASAEDLKGIAPGTAREEVLKLGPPASRISMFDDGHLLEIYSYATRNTPIGVVRLNDGAVSRVELQ
jgi:hypothetical protein